MKHLSRLADEGVQLRKRVEELERRQAELNAMWDDLLEEIDEINSEVADWNKRRRAAL